MARGRPDWSENSALTGVWGVNDLGELAARLNALSTFDRRGMVVWQDDFGDGLGSWSSGTSGTGAKITISHLDSHRNGTHARLVGGSTDSRYAEVWSNLPIAAYNRIGWEAFIAAVSSYESFGIRLIYRDGVRLYRATAYYYSSDKSIRILKADGTMQTLATNLPYLQQGDVYNLMKLVIDLPSKKYIRLVFNDTQYDISSYALNDYAASSDKLLVGIVTVISNVGSNGIINVDSAIMTRDEP